MSDRLYIGIDDTDSARAMCTTYIAAKALKMLEEKGYKRADYPWLIRLNPNCPYKTRGNAALCLVINVNGLGIDNVKKVVKEIVDRYADIDSSGTDPGIVFVKEEQKASLINHYWRSIREIVELDEAFRLCRDLRVEYQIYKDGRGIIGALAAAGADESTLKTYELIAYRVPENWGKPRKIDRDSVIRMDLVTHPFTFDNYDYEKDSIRITPNTPCPVFLGIRSVSAKHALMAYEMLQINEPIAFYELFKTNQATDSHYVRKRIRDLSPLQSVILTGKVSSKPRIIEGGHVFIEMEDDTGKITLAAYEPTGSLRRVILDLIPGDLVEAYGAVKMKPQGLTLNLEKIHILELTPKIVFEAPICPSCGKRTKSIGKEKGYRCRKCGIRMKDAKPVPKIVERKMTIGFYDVAISARRHLVSPSNLFNLSVLHP